MSDATFPVVGIGASAGGLEACRQMLAGLPPDPGMAFVLVQHLDPDHPSHLSEILARSTAMPVLEAADGMEVRRDHFYVIPPNASLEIANGRLRTAPRIQSHHPHLPVDRFLRSLAQDADERAVAVILSGSGSDGALALGEVKTAGGVTIAQDEGSARHTGMPHAAAQSSFVDFILPPAEIASRLLQLNGHPYLVSAQQQPAIDDREFGQILGHLRSVTGVDFSQYRDTTVKRRILRRAMLCGEQSPAGYFAHLGQDPGEIQALYRDLLIDVTSFFRDPALFDRLKTDVFPHLLEQKPEAAPLRIWVPGCSTGQEAYSIAIVIQECLDGAAVRPAVQIFATDLGGESTLGKARAGVYPAAIEGEISPERLRRFFRKEGHSYRVDKTIRDMCIFAEQNITADPPFSRVDLISCRNVLIYMTPLLQQRVLPIFHFALNVPGYLVLGTSETAGPLADKFDLVDRTWKIYAKKPGPHVYAHGLSAGYMPDRLAAHHGPAASPPSAADMQKAADRILLDRNSTSGVLINENFDILQFRGSTGAFLESPRGEPTTSLLKMAPEGLFLELKRALHEAKAGKAPVFRKGVRMRTQGATRQVNLEVAPVALPGAQERCFLVLFEDAAPQNAAGAKRDAMATGISALRRLFGRSAELRNRGPDRGPGDAEFARLRQELGATKEYMQSLLEQQDATNEELRSANKEVLSSNEELQSTNEKLETAKEELESTNEELTTVNEEVHQRNLELDQINNNFANLLSSTDIPLVVVGSDLRIRLFTPPATQMMKLLPADVGRPIGDIRPAIAVDNLEDRIREVVTTVQPLHDEVRDHHGKWHALRIHPYRTADGRIDGAVVVLVDIDDIRRTHDLLQQQTATLKAADQRKNELLGMLQQQTGMLRQADQHKNAFLAMLGHELRNPLGSISNALQIMSMPRAGAQDLERARNVLERQLAQLTRIVEDLLDATRIAQGKVELRRERIDLATVLNAAVQTTRPSFDEYGHRLEIEPCPQATYVDADPLRLTQILVNLLNNAAKFTGKNGEIHLACRVADGGRDALITVRDNGIGIAPQMLPYIFDLFTQADTYKNRRRGGLGIGLTLARNLAELHGGSIAAHSKGAGKGSEFIVRLPLAGAAPAGAEANVGAASRRREIQPRRILIIEDSIDQAQTLAALLTLWGHEVKMAREGEAGIELAQEFLPDIALVDLGLPGISGYEVARRMKAHPKLKHIRLIAQTGWGQAQDRQRAEKAGLDHLLLKPLDLEELTSLLATIEPHRPATD